MVLNPCLLAIFTFIFISSAALCSPFVFCGKLYLIMPFSALSTCVYSSSTFFDPCAGIGKMRLSQFCNQHIQASPGRPSGVLFVRTVVWLLQPLKSCLRQVFHQYVMRMN